MKTKEDIKKTIKKVEKEIMKETKPSRKERLNKYKQKLAIELRDFTRFQNN